MPEVTVKLDPSVVDTHVRAAMMEALGKDPDALVRAVVDAAMSQKADTYGRKTIFQETVEGFIRSLALEAFQEWVEVRRESIKKLMLDRLTERGDKSLDDLAAAVVKAMGEGFRVDVRLREAPYQS